MTACPCWPALSLAQHMLEHPSHVGRGQCPTSVCRALAQHVLTRGETACSCCSAGLLGAPLSRVNLYQESTSQTSWVPPLPLSGDQSSNCTALHHAKYCLLPTWGGGYCSASGYCSPAQS